MDIWSLGGLFYHLFSPAKCMEGSSVKSQDYRQFSPFICLWLFMAAGNIVSYSQSHFNPLPGEIWHRLPLSADTALLNRDSEKSSGSPSVQGSCGEKACSVLQAGGIIDEMMSAELPVNLPVSGKV